jgi:hypothetical protein
MRPIIIYNFIQNSGVYNGMRVFLLGFPGQYRKYPVVPSSDDHINADFPSHRGIPDPLSVNLQHLLPHKITKLKLSHHIK